MDDITVMGQKTFHGKVHSEKLKVVGHGKINDEITAKQIENKGVLTVRELARVELLTNIGQFIAGNIEAEEVDSTGHIGVNGNVNASKSFRSVGSIDVKGKLSSPLISIRGGWLLGKRSICNHIVGEEVYIEKMDTLYVEGKSVIIGRNSHVKELQYTDRYEIHPTSTVEKVVHRSSAHV